MTDDILMTKIDDLIISINYVVSRIDALEKKINSINPVKHTGFKMTDCASGVRPCEDSATGCDCSYFVSVPK